MAGEYENGRPRIGPNPHPLPCREGVPAGEGQRAAEVTDRGRGVVVGSG